MNRMHDTPVLVASLLVPAGLAADAAPPASPPARSSLSVSATVVRPPAAPAIALRDGAVLISNPGGVGVTVEGGVARPERGATIRIEPGRGGVTWITLSY